MKLYSILKIPDPRLKQKAYCVESVNSEIQGILDCMLETMYANEGIGLAGPQVGISQRLVVIDLQEGNQRRPYKMVNPEVIWASPERQTFQEGCLSVPEQYEEVTRSNRIHVKYLDENNIEKKIEATGLFATCIQHEIDHLNGILFLDHLSPLKKRLLTQKSFKASSKSSLQNI